MSIYVYFALIKKDNGNHHLRFVDFEDGKFTESSQEDVLIEAQNFLAKRVIDSNFNGVELPKKTIDFQREKEEEVVAVTVEI